MLKMVDLERSGEPAVLHTAQSILDAGEFLFHRLGNLPLIFREVLEFEGRPLPLVLPEIVTPALSFLERLRSTGPRLQDWPPPFLLRLIGGAFFAFDRKSVGVG